MIGPLRVFKMWTLVAWWGRWSKQNTNECRHSWTSNTMYSLSKFSSKKSITIHKYGSQVNNYTRIRIAIYVAALQPKPRTSCPDSELSRTEIVCSVPRYQSLLLALLEGDERDFGFGHFGCTTLMDYLKLHHTIWPALRISNLLPSSHFN